MIPTAGQTLQWIVITLLAVAVIMVNSASMGVAGQPLGPMDLIFGRPTLYAIMAVLVMWVTSSVDLRGIYKTPVWCNPMHYLLLAGVVLCGVALIPGVGTNLNGSSRWLTIGFGSASVNFQPSEIVKWALILVLAWWCARRGDRTRMFFSSFVPAMFIVGAVCGLIAIEDLGTAVLIGTAATTILFAGGVRLWQVALTLPAIAGGVVFLIIESPYRLQRLLTFLNPYADPEGSGYHAIQSLVAFTGPEYGLGNGRQKLGYLPAQTNDFIYAVIREELGIAGALGIVAIYALLIWCGLRIVRQTRHAFLKLVALGIFVTIGLQAIINLAVVTVLVPTKGIPLPLLSAGGTGWITIAAAVGLLVAIDRVNEIEAAHGREPDLAIGREPVHRPKTLSVSASQAAP